jgi:hypothetical protein
MPDDKTTDKPTDKPADKPAGHRGGAAMRRALITKLPALEYKGSSVLEAVKLDTDSDLRGAIELDAEAFLAPLELTTRPRGAR